MSKISLYNRVPVHINYKVFNSVTGSKDSGHGISSEKKKWYYYKRVFMLTKNIRLKELSYNIKQKVEVQEDPSFLCV